MWYWVFLILGVVIALAVIGTLILPKIPASSEEKREMEALAEEKRKLKSGEVTSKRKWFFIYLGLCFPVANLVILLVLAFKKEKTNPTIRNWARANLIFLIIGIVLAIASTLLVYFFFKDAFMAYLNQLATM